MKIFCFQAELMLKHLKGLHDCVTLLDKEHEVIVGVILVSDTILLPPLTIIYSNRFLYKLSKC